MLLELLREELRPACTLGRLYEGAALLCVTLEDRLPTPYVKVPGETCIPCGKYEVVITHSPRFNVDMPLLLNVPGFTGVRIHTGNAALDTEGCILVGQERVGEKLLHSRAAYAALFQKIQAARARGELVHIDVKLADGGVCHAEGA
jgi:hypothetical protein